MKTLFEQFGGHMCRTGISLSLTSPFPIACVYSGICDGDNPITFFIACEKEDSDLKPHKYAVSVMLFPFFSIITAMFNL